MYILQMQIKVSNKNHSFFQKYNHKGLTEISEIIKSFIVMEFYAKKTKEFVKTEYNIIIVLPLLDSIFKDIRGIIYDYLD